MVEAIAEIVGEGTSQHWIGIDLGTKNTIGAIWKNGCISILQNPDDGLPTTPSVVAYTRMGDTVVGNAALKQQARNMENTLFDMKRLIGREINDERSVKDREQWPFDIVEGNSNRPMIRLSNNKGEEKQLYPEEIQAKILEKIQKAASIEAQ